MPDRQAARFIKTTFTGYRGEPVRDIFGSRVLVLVAHPDDETAGAGALMRHLRTVVLAHVTDGAPRDLADAASCGFSSAAEYAAARREELSSALSVAGLRFDRRLECGIPDQEAWSRLGEVTAWVKGVADEFRPETILTHAYEGGHPDHDSVAFASHAAAALMGRGGAAMPSIIEFPMYHAAPAGPGMGTGFIPREDAEPITFILTREERRLKRAMFERFTSQAGVLRSLGVEEETFRQAPMYEFRDPPHEGPLFYERLGWAVDGRLWRAEAAKAMAALGLEGPL